MGAIDWVLKSSFQNLFLPSYGRISYPSEQLKTNVTLWQWVHYVSTYLKETNENQVVNLLVQKRPGKYIYLERKYFVPPDRQISYHSRIRLSAEKFIELNKTPPSYLPMSSYLYLCQIKKSGRHLPMSDFYRSEIMDM